MDDLAAVEDKGRGFLHRTVASLAFLFVFPSLGRKVVLCCRIIHIANVKDRVDEHTVDFEFSCELPSSRALPALSRSCVGGTPQLSRASRSLAGGTFSSAQELVHVTRK